MISYAIKIAERSTNKTHKTGAAIYDRKGNLIANGWSHIGMPRLSLYSTHAELHALRRSHKPIQEATIYIATLAAKNSHLALGKPCKDCVRALRDSGVTKVVFTTADGEVEMHIDDLIDCKEYSRDPHRGCD